MKILKTVLFVIIGFVILFFAMGIIKPSVKYGHEITVNKSLDEAWVVSQDESKYGEWLEGFKSIDLISGAQGEVGSKYKVVVNPGEGQEDFEMTETVVSKKENDHFTLHFESDMMDFDQTTSFFESDGKAKVKTESEVSGKGMMMRSMFACMEMFTNSFQKQEEKNIDALKKLIDENTTDYFSAPMVTEEKMVQENN